MREFGRAPNHDDYLRLDDECERRTLAFIRNNAAAKKPFYLAWWPVLGSFMPSPKKLTSNGGLMAEMLARLDVRIGTLMGELEELGIAENTLVVLMADNGPMTHNGPTGHIETLYRGGKGDYLEGGVRVPAMAWWPSVISPGQMVGDIVHCTDLYTTFARLGGATEYIPTDRIIDGIDQTTLFLKGDTFSRRDYVYIYTGPILAATVKGRYKRVWVGEKPGLSGAAFFDLYTEPPRGQRQVDPDAPGQGDVQHHESQARVVDGEISEHTQGARLAASGNRQCPPGNPGRRPAARGRLEAPVRSEGVHQSTEELGGGRVR